MQSRVVLTQGVTLRIIPTETEEAIGCFEAALATRDGSEHTVRGYVSDMRRFAQWYHERHPHASLTQEAVSADLYAYRDHMVDELRCKPATINRHLQSLRRFFRHLCRDGARKTNPAADVQSVRKPKRLRPLSLTDDEVRRLLGAAGKSAHGQGPRNYALVQLMLQTGLRVSEVVGLVGDDVVVRERSGTVRVRAGKGLRERTVPLSAVCRRALTRYFEIRGVPRASEAVFVSTRGSALAQRSAQHAVARSAAVAGIDRLAVGAHTLRHTFAARFLDANPDDLVGLATLLGHESLETTAVYVRPSAADLAARVERASR